MYRIEQESIPKVVTEGALLLLLLLLLALSVMGVVAVGGLEGGVEGAESPGAERNCQSLEFVV